MFFEKIKENIMILKIDNKGISKDEIFKTEFDFIVDANEYYHKHCTLDEDYDINQAIASFEEAKNFLKPKIIL